MCTTESLKLILTTLKLLQSLMHIGRKIQRGVSVIEANFSVVNINLRLSVVHIFQTLLSPP